MIFDCYGHDEGGVALVSADSREQAVRACREWLGWAVTVAFRAPKKYRLWQSCGGSAATPVVYAEDGEQYEAVILRRGG